MEQIDHHRRRFLGLAATGAAATAVPFRLLSGYAAAAGIGQPSNQGNSAMATMEADAIRPFRVNVPEEELDGLRRRILATRWPERETRRSSVAIPRHPASQPMRSARMSS
jgi:hypothetical protein